MDHKTEQMGPTPCVGCGTPVHGYKPEYCCNGRDCGCHGLPIEPCLCQHCEPWAYSTKTHYDNKTEKQPITITVNYEDLLQQLYKHPIGFPIPLIAKILNIPSNSIEAYEISNIIKELDPQWHNKQSTV